MHEFSKNQALVLSVFLLAVAGVTAIDVVVDVNAGATWRHVAIEVAVVIGTLGLLIWLWTSDVKALRGQIMRSQDQIAQLRLEARQWQETIAGIKPGLSEAIEKKFDEWTLTQAEKDIAKLILKGFSNKEIAALRQGSEHTIKQQTHAIYKKSKLASRAQLAAFFLEDLF